MKFGRSERRSTATEPSYSQDEHRIRRRQGLGNHLVGTWRLETGIVDVLGPFALDVTTLRDPRATRRTIEEIGEAVAAIVHVAAALVAESRATDGQTRRLVADLAVKTPPAADQRRPDRRRHMGRGVRPLRRGDCRRSGRPAQPQITSGTPRPARRPERQRARRACSPAEVQLGGRGFRMTDPGVQKRQALPSIEEYNQQQREQAERERVDRAMTRMGPSCPHRRRHGRSAPAGHPRLHSQIYPIVLQRNNIHRCNAPIITLLTGRFV